MLTSEERQQLFPPVLPAFVRFCKAFPPLMEDVVSLLLQYGRICASEASRRPLTVEGLTSSGSGSVSSTFNRSPRHTTVGFYYLKISTKVSSTSNFQLHATCDNTLGNFNTYLFDERISKMCKEFKNMQRKEHFMRAYPNKAEKSCLVGWIGSAILLVRNSNRAVLFQFFAFEYMKSDVCKTDNTLKNR